MPNSIPKKPHRSSLNIRAIGDVPWRSNRMKTPSRYKMEAKGYKQPQDTRSVNAASSILSTTDIVDQKSNDQDTAMKEVKEHGNRDADVYDACRKDLNHNVPMPNTKVTSTESSSKSLMARDSNAVPFITQEEIEVIEVIDLIGTSKPDGINKLLHEAVDKAYCSAFSIEKLNKMKIPDIVQLVLPLISSSISISWSTSAVEVLHIIQLSHVPDEQSTRRLRNEIDDFTPEQAINIKSIAITVLSHTIRVPREALRYWLDIHNASSRIPTLRSAHEWLWTHLRYNDPIINYFTNTPLSTTLRGFPLASQAATTSSLISLMSTNWITETVMECGLDYLKTLYPNLRGKVLFQPPFFWQSCQRSWERKTLSTYLHIFLRDFDEVRESVQTIYFPMCSAEHWFLGIISLETKEIVVADSLGSMPPKDFYNILKYILETFLKVDVIDYEETRKSCPRQEDGHSCGIVVLSLLDHLCANGHSDSWCPALATQFRIKWLRRLIEHDGSSGELIESSQSKTPTDKCSNDDETPSDSGGIQPNSDQPKEIQHPTSQVPYLPSFYPILTRKSNPLQYPVDEPGTVESKCMLCGPPFHVFDTILGMEVCSFECAKRYVELALAHPRGFKVKHGKTQPSDNTFEREGIKYRKLSLRCEYSRKPESKKKANLVPEAQRAKLSKRTNCQWKVNISWPESRPTPYISHVVSKHSGHEDYSGIQKKFIDKMTSEQIAFVEAFALIPKTSRTYLMEVLTSLFPQDFFNPKQIGNIMNQVRNERRKSIIANGGEIMTLLQRLGDLKANDDSWIYYPDFKSSTSEDGTTTHELTRIFWMSPDQREMGKRYGDILQVDVSENRNMYYFYLTTFVLVDGENKSRNLAYCMHNRQDAESFEWIFRRLDPFLNVGCEFTAIFSDRDPALIAAVNAVWSHIFHGHCLWHLWKNLRKNLGPLLQGEFNTFMADFWNVYRVGSPPMFLEKWGILLRNWPRAAQYLNNNIFPDRDTFAYPWVGMRFLAGLRTTGRVECEHKIYKLRGLCGSSTFNEVFDLLCKRTDQQKDLAEYQEYKASQIKYPIGGDLKRYFAPIAHECRFFMTCSAYGVIHHELEAAIKIPFIREVHRDEYEHIYAIEQESHEVFEVDPGFDPTNGEGGMYPVDPLQERYITLEWLLDSIPLAERLSTVVLYEVRGHDQYNSSGELRPVRSRFVAIRQNHFELCTCLKGRHTGIPCRHFFAVVKAHPLMHPFNIAQVHEHWITYEARVESIDRAWIYLAGPPSVPRPVINSQNPSIARPGPVPSTQQKSPIESFNNRFNTPNQTPRKKANTAYAKTMEITKHFLKTNSSEEAGEELLVHLQNLITKAHDRNRQANPIPEGGSNIIDPPKNSAKGRKRNARIKGNDESPKKQRK